jgi:hypothetical protein
MTSDPEGEDDEELSHLVLKQQLQKPEYSRLNKKNQEKTCLNYHQKSCSLNFPRGLHVHHLSKISKLSN